jgi:hypothetical protein
MNSLDGIIRVPKDLKNDARRLATLILILAPIGAVSAFMLAQASEPRASTRSAVTPAAPVTTNLQAPTSLQVPVINPLVQAPQQTNASVEMHTSQSSSAQPPVTKIQVNQQSIDIPPDGTVHKVISSDGSTTTLDVTNSTNGSSDTSSSSSTNIQLNTSSSTVTNSQTDTGP